MNKKSQSIFDYTAVFAIIIAVLLVMGYYVRNSLMGKIREAGDAYGGGEVYEPGKTVITNNKIQMSK